MRTLHRSVLTLLLASVVATARAQTTQPATAPAAEDRAALLSAADRVLHAARSLDRDALIKCMVQSPDADAANKSVAWLTVESSSVALAADRKFGPQQGIGDEDWSFPTEEAFARAVHDDPSLVEIHGSTAHIFPLGDFRKQPDGTWALDAAESNSLQLSDDPKFLAALDAKFKQIERDIASGALKDRDAVRDRVLRVLMRG